MQIAVASLALVSLVLRGPPPGFVEVKSFAPYIIIIIIIVIYSHKSPLTLFPCSIVLAVTAQLTVLVLLTLTGVAVALTATSYGEVRHA